MKTELELSELNPNAQAAPPSPPINEISLMDLPAELIGMIGHHAGTPELAKLAGTCSRLHFLLQPTVKERYALLAKELMEYVLYPTQENIAKAKAMVAANPQIMFIETEGLEKASGIEEYIDDAGQAQTRAVYRKIKCSPFQAALGTGDSELYQYMATHFDKMQAGVETAQKQMKEKFPNGFDYPPSTYDFSALVKAITSDQTLIGTSTPSEATKEILAQFRKDFLPQDVTQGHHFNLNHLIKAFETYNQNWDLWNGNQLSLFFRQAIGYLERQVTVVDAAAFIEGVDNHLEKKGNNRLHDRSLTLYNYQSSSNISYFDDSSPATRLGFDFGIYIWRPGRLARWAGRGVVGGGPMGGCGGWGRSAPRR